MTTIPGDSSLFKWHSRVAEVIVANPQFTIKQVAEMFDVNPLTIRMMLDTEAFRARLRDARRRRNGQAELRVKKEHRGYAHRGTKED